MSNPNKCLTPSQLRGLKNHQCCDTSCKPSHNVDCIKFVDPCGNVYEAPVEDCSGCLLIPADYAPEKTLYTNQSPLDVAPAGWDGTAGWLVYEVRADGTRIRWEWPCNGTGWVSDAHSVVVDNEDGSYTAINGDGSTVTWLVGDNDTFVTVVSNGDGTATITRPDGTSLDVCEICPVMVDNEDGSYTFTNSDGSVVTITTAVDTDTWTTFESNEDGTATFSDPEGNVISVCEICPSLSDNGDGSFTFYAADGSTTVIPAPVDVDSWTTFVSNGDGTVTFTDPAGNTQIVCEVCPTLVDNEDGTYTFTGADGSVVTITTTIDTDTWTTFESNGDGTATFTDPVGNELVVCEVCPTLVDNENGTYTFTAADGSTTVIDTNIDTDTWTMFESNGDGTATFTDPDGNELIVCEVCPTLDANADGSYTFTHADGSTVDIAAPTNSTLVDNGDSTITHTSGDGTVTVVDICAIVGDNCNATIVVNADGSLTHTDNSGNTTNVPAPVSSTLTDNGNGTFTHTGADGTATVIDICALQAAGGCIASLVNNGNGTYTYTDENGVATVIDVNDVILDITNVTVLGDTITFTGEGGVVVVADICAMVAANCNSPMTLNADGSFTYVDNAGNVTIIPAPTGPSTVINNNDGTFTHVSGTGTVTNLDVCQMVQQGGCTDSMVVNADGSVTHTALDGNIITIPAPTVSTMTDNGDGTVTHTSGDGTATVLDICALVAAGGCSDSLVVNADGSVTHTALDGTVVTIPAHVPSSVTENQDGSYTHDDGQGNTTSWGPGTTFVDNTDGTGQVTDPDNDDCAVPLQKLQDKCAVDFAKGDELRIIEADDPDIAQFWPEPVIGADGCTPEDPPCPDMAWHTTHCDKNWYWPAGGGWTSLDSARPRQLVARSGNTNSGVIDFAATPPTLVSRDEIAGPVGATWTNPSCHATDTLILIDLSHLDVVPITGTNFRIGAYVQTRINGGGWVDVIHAIWRNEALTIDGESHAQNHDLGKVWTFNMTVAGKGNVTIDARILLDYDPGGTDALDPSIDRWQISSAIATVRIIG